MVYILSSPISLLLQSVIYTPIEGERSDPLTGSYTKNTNNRPSWLLKYPQSKVRNILGLNDTLEIDFRCKWLMQSGIQGLKDLCQIAIVKARLYVVNVHARRTISRQPLS